MKPEKALEMALDAHALDSTAKAAKKHGVSERTVFRANAQVAADPAMTENVTAKKKELARELQQLRMETMREGLNQIRLKMPDGELRDVAGAYKIVSDSHEVAQEVLSVGLDNVRPSPDKDAEEVAQGTVVVTAPSGWLESPAVGGSH